MNKKISVRWITGVAILTALVCVLGAISNYTPGALANTNYGLIVIIIGACVYGPIAGLFLGLIDGVFCIIAPATLGSFMLVHPGVTIVLCLLKTGLAGLASGYVYKALYKKNSWVAIILASIVVPVVNTGLYLIGAETMFTSIFEGIAAQQNMAVGQYIIVGTLSFNFAIETAIVVILSPALHRILTLVSKNKNIGSVYSYENKKESKKASE